MSIFAASFEPMKWDFRYFPGENPDLCSPPNCSLQPGLHLSVLEPPRELTHRESRIWRKYNAMMYRFWGRMRWTGPTSNLSAQYLWSSSRPFALHRFPETFHVMFR